MKKECLIIAGGEWDTTFASRYVKEKYGMELPTVITADLGLSRAVRLGLWPDLLLGDFDSLDRSYLEDYRKQTGKEPLFFPSEKDDTDSALAVEAALEQGASHICILGGTGGRLDHTLANISLLVRCMEAGVQGELVDSCNRIRLIDARLDIRKDEQFGAYVSLLPLSADVTGITLEGFRYPLTNAVISQGMTLGVSNEILGETGSIRIRTGKLLVIESRDK